MCVAADLKFHPWECAVACAATGTLDEPSHALRDPAILQEDGRIYLFYAVAGESGIGVAELRTP